VDGRTEAWQADAQAVTDAFWLVLTTSLSQLPTLGLAFVLRRQLGPLGTGYVATVELLLGVALTDRLLDGAGAAGVVLGAAAQAILFRACWLSLAAAFLHSHDAARDDFRLLLNLAAKGLERVRSAILRSIA
jgi:hypothetical protein